MGSTINVSFQFSSVMGYCTAAAALAAAAATGAEGTEGADGMTEATDAVAWLKKPLTFSRSGICCSARASAGRARTAVVEKRIIDVRLRCGGLRVAMATNKESRGVCRCL